MIKAITKTLSLSPKFSKSTKHREIDLTKYNLYKEIDRRSTFLENKWKNSSVNIDLLALLGLFFAEKPDTVLCAFCNVHLNEFEPNDDVLKEHLKVSPNCPLLRRRETENEPLDAEALDKVLPPASWDECGSSHRRKKSRVEDEVAYPEYRVPSARMKSFETWPKSIKLKPADLVEAGFFYSGQFDITICFSCGVFVAQWEEDDNPWVEHKKLLEKECNYLNLNQEKLKLNEQKYEELQKSQVLVEPKSEDLEHDDKELDIETRCKVCLVNKSSLVFMPCQHVAVCGQCVFGIGPNCPICRSAIEKTIPLFYA